MRPGIEKIVRKKPKYNDERNDSKKNKPRRKDKEASTQELLSFISGNN